ncbi:MAG: energy-coupling factor ABC transporter permease [Candidatus Heimdallarchaeota archaeon]|nr:MAG: energy-coupling factor ABC transporter permease [Candidatus Heimdallarchaeota archaeon]
MHIPDGWVDPAFIIVTWIITIAAIAVAIRKLRDVDETRIAYMAVLGGTIFAAQMLNFPIIGGTSGHLLGGVLAAAIVGPWAAILIITVILIIQALLFADGGVLALGPNIFNMGIIGVFVGYIIIIIFVKNTDPEKAKLRYYGGIFCGAFLSVVTASFFAALEIGTPIINSPAAIPLIIALPTIVFYHILIGLGEGMITCLIIFYFHSIDLNVFLELESPSIQIPRVRRYRSGD